MRLRKRQVDTVSLDEPVEDEEGVPQPRDAERADWSENPDQVLLDAEMRRVMDEAVASLSETLRSVLVLRDVNQLSTAQAAQVLGLSEEAVKSRLLRARLALRKKAIGLHGQARGGGETMKNKECRHLLGQLADYVDGEASQALCQEIERHLSGCENCRVVVDTLRKTVTL